LSVQGPHPEDLSLSRPK